MSSFERKILRMVYEPVVKQGIWRIRTNQELRELHKGLDIVADIKMKCLGWIRCVIRMDQERTVMKVFESKLEGNRRRPRLRWLEDVEKDLWEMKVKRW
jgi:hypothetical protein